MRYVIKSGEKMLSHFDQEGVAEHIEQDAAGNRFLVNRPRIIPIFEAARNNEAAKFDQQSDAEEIMKHPHLKDADAFKGATVVAVES